MRKSKPDPGVIKVKQLVQTLGSDLAALRRSLGISALDLAAGLRIGRNTLWRLEQGDATVAVGTVALAAVLLDRQDRLEQLFAVEAAEPEVQPLKAPRKQRISRPRPPAPSTPKKAPAGRRRR